MISFNEPVNISKGVEYINKVIQENKRLNGDGEYTKRCSEWLEKNFHAKKVLLTTSCTHALEMAALLCEIKVGDEVIMPSYTFVTTANAFVLRGAKVKFVDIRKDTMNMDETLIENAITKKTRAIVPVHYAGVGCEMDAIMQIAKDYHLFVVEDAAQGMMATYKEKFLGTIGDFGTYSFHETKNYTMGEGGLILINQESYISKGEIIREKGTNRTQFFRGEVDKYSWVDIGSSYLPSEMNAAYLYAQLEIANEINQKRLDMWDRYYAGLKRLEQKERIELPHIPEECQHNGHIFYIKTLFEITSVTVYADDPLLLQIHEQNFQNQFASTEEKAEFIEFRKNYNSTLEFVSKKLKQLLNKDEEIDYIIEKIEEFYQTN